MNHDAVLGSGEMVNIAHFTKSFEAILQAPKCAVRVNVLCPGAVGGYVLYSLDDLAAHRQTEKTNVAR